ncbi:hypothetical protein RQP46_010872 [Phenoliferia psychrophenolica]
MADAKQPRRSERLRLVQLAFCFQAVTALLPLAEEEAAAERVAEATAAADLLAASTSTTVPTPTAAPSLLAKRARDSPPPDSRVVAPDILEARARTRAKFNAGATFRKAINALKSKYPQYKDFTFVPRNGEAGSITGLTDKNGRLFALRQEAPKYVLEEGLSDKLEALVQAFTDGGKNEGSSLKRGDHMGAKAGVFRDMGAIDPHYNRYYLGRQQEWDTFLQDPVVTRQIGRMDSLFSDFYPAMHAYYEDLKASIKASRGLNFLGGAFASVCLNTGNSVIAKLHRDHVNLLLGLCLILAMGDFDSRLGGHLVLLEAGVILELAPGDLALIPSAGITHGNLPIQKGERRNSMAFWTSGNVFLWKELGNRSMSKLSPKEQAAYMKMSKEGLLDMLRSHFPIQK